MRASKWPSAPASSSTVTLRRGSNGHQVDPLFKDAPVTWSDWGVSKGDAVQALDRRGCPCRDGPRQAAISFRPDTVRPCRVGGIFPLMVDGSEPYVARRLVERERALSDDEGRGVAQSVLGRARNQRRYPHFPLRLDRGCGHTFGAGHAQRPALLTAQHEALLLCNLTGGGEHCARI